MDHSVLITGGTGALGGAVVDVFLEAGWRVVTTWIVPADRDRLPEASGFVAVEADLFDEAQAAEAVSQASSDNGAPLAAVVNLVGGFDAGARVHETPVDRFEGQLRLNLRPTYLVTQASLPKLIDSGGGTIVCVSARAALTPFAGAAGYITAKAAVLAFAQAVATEYRDDGIRCNAVLPSVIDTPANRDSQPDADHSRWVQPIEIAHVIRFLCSDGSAPTSGAAIPVYGRA
ncbi:MAG: SDR family NAD(P)-dependent oxidoreductase [Solirubrobacterales bacterium]